MKKKNSLALFGQAFKNAKNDFWVSIQVLLVATFVLALIFYFVEHTAQPEEYKSPWDAFVWAITRYIGDPGHFAGDGPVTLVGRYVDTLIGILKILIFAVPAGLVANGFRKAMDDEKRRLYMEDIRLRIKKAFGRTHHKNLEDYLDSKPEFSELKSSKSFHWFAPQKVSIARLQVRGLKLSDIIDAVNQFPEFRLKNMATAMSSEDQPEDRLVVEHYPLNTDYGCMIDRKSNITIVATSSYTEVGTGWFAYYLAKLGGFNYICKEIDIDRDEPESFYAMPSHIKVNDITEEEMRKDEKKYREELKLVDKKRKSREQFLADLKQLCEGGNKWCVMLLAHIKNQVNAVDLHINHCRKDGQDSTVNDMEAYNNMLNDMQIKMRDDFQLTAEESTRYPLMLSNLAYKLKKDGCDVNGFTIRVSYDILCFDSRIHAIMYRMASVLNNNLHGRGSLEMDEEDFKTRRRFCYSEFDNYKNIER